MTNTEVLEVLRDMQTILDESRKRVDTARAVMALKSAIKSGGGVS